MVNVLGVIKCLITYCWQSQLFLRTNILFFVTNEPINLLVFSFILEIQLFIISFIRYVFRSIKSLVISFREQYLNQFYKTISFDVHGSVHHSIIHKENPTRCNIVSKFYFIFIWSSTCFGWHTAHHQELKTAVTASGFSYCNKQI